MICAFEEGNLYQNSTCCFCSPDEPTSRLPQKISASLKQALEKLKLSDNVPEKKGNV